MNRPKYLLLLLVLSFFVLCEANLKELEPISEPRADSIFEEDMEESKSNKDCLPSGSTCEKKCRLDAEKLVPKSAAAATKRLWIAKCLETDCVEATPTCHQKCRSEHGEKYGKHSESKEATIFLDHCFKKCCYDICKEQHDRGLFGSFQVTRSEKAVNSLAQCFKGCDKSPEKPMTCTEVCYNLNPECKETVSDSESIMDSDSARDYDPEMNDDDFVFDFEDDYDMMKAACDRTRLNACRVKCGKPNTPDVPPSHSKPSCTYKSSKCTDRLSLADFTSMYSNYPTMKSSEFKKTVGGKVNASWINHTCAVRLSYAINKSSFEVRPKSLEGVLNTVKGGDGLEYAYRVKELLAYLKKKQFTMGFTKVWRNPSPNSKHESGYVPEEFKCERGIIYFKLGGYCGSGGKKSSASNHIDLFDGERCAGACYFKCSNEVSIISVCDENTSCCRA